MKCQFTDCLRCGDKMEKCQRARAVTARHLAKNLAVAALGRKTQFQTARKTWVRLAGPPKQLSLL